MTHITYHARTRMEERGITTPMVDAVLHSAEPENWSCNGAYRLSLCGVNAVVERGTGLVITVYEDIIHKVGCSQKKWAKMKSKCRRERERRQKRRLAW